jgi:hypothetical protein
MVVWLCGGTTDGSQFAGRGGGEGVQLGVSLGRLSVGSYDDWRSELPVFVSGLFKLGTDWRKVCQLTQKNDTQHTFGVAELVAVVSAEVPNSKVKFAL